MNIYICISILQFNNHGGIDLLWKCLRSEYTWLRWRKIVSMHRKLLKEVVERRVKEES